MKWLTVTPFTVSSTPNKLEQTSNMASSDLQNQSDSKQDSSRTSEPPSNGPTNGENGQIQASSTLPYAFAAQFEAIQRQETVLAAPPSPGFTSQFETIERQEMSLTQPSDPRVRFALPREKHPESELAPRPPYIQLPQRQPYPRPMGSIPLTQRVETPVLAPPNTAEESSGVTAAAERPELPRTPSYLHNPLGWTQDMNAVAIGMLETESIEKVLQHFIKENPDSGDHQAIREHLQALVIQFHG